MRINSEIQQLVQGMQEVVDAVMRACQTDFTVIDIQTIREMEQLEPFFWLVRESGTCIARESDEDSVKNLIEWIESQVRNRDDFVLYHYWNGLFQPIFPREFFKWAAKEYGITPIEYYQLKIK